MDVDGDQVGRLQSNLPACGDSIVMKLTAPFELCIEVPSPRPVNHTYI